MAEEYIGADLDAAVGQLIQRGGIDRPARVALGGCAEAIGTGRQGAMRRSAHAHTAADDPRRGWICIKGSGIARVIGRTGKPTRLLAHEWAHLATWEGHTRRWQALMRKLGHPKEAAGYAARVKARQDRQGQLVPCPVLAAGAACPFSDRPAHRHSERVGTRLVAWEQQA